MASEKQLKANRENAKRSSGPKTAVGRWRSSRNALRHGLSLPLSADPAASMKARQIAQMLVPERADDAQGFVRSKGCGAPSGRKREGKLRPRTSARTSSSSSAPSAA